MFETYQKTISLESRSDPHGTTEKVNSAVARYLNEVRAERAKTAQEPPEYVWLHALSTSFDSNFEMVYVSLIVHARPSASVLARDLREESAARGPQFAGQEASRHA